MVPRRLQVPGAKQVLFAMYMCNVFAPGGIGSVFVCDWTGPKMKEIQQRLMWRNSSVVFRFKHPNFRTFLVGISCFEFVISIKFEEILCVSKKKLKKILGES